MTESNEAGSAADGSALRPRAHLLAIDDDETNLALLSSVLAAYQLTTFSGPHAALAALREGLLPDLIVCDVTMPGMTGFELHAQLRELPPLRSVPFIYLTALDRSADMRTGMGLGADDYLTKPYAPAELRAAVESRLARASTLRVDAAAEWRVTSLGGLDVKVGERRLAWESRRAAVLFLLLLSAARDGGVPHSLVRSELWWHAPSGNQLHALTSRLRKALGDAASIVSDGDTVRLTGADVVVWDAPSFERAAAEALSSRAVAAIEGALAIYRGTFLPGADGPWAERTRTHLEGVALQLLEAAVEASEGAARERAERRLEAFLDE